MEFERVTSNDLVAGDRTLWNMYEESGKLLIPKGKIISNESLLNRLIAMGLFADREELLKSREEWRAAKMRQVQQSNKPPSTVGTLMAARRKLDAMVAQLDRSIQGKWLSDKVGELADEIVAACDADGDVAIAMILLRQEGKYAIRHMVNVAIVTALVCRSLEKPAPATRSIVAGALTMNIGMIEFQDQLKEQTTPLSPAQRGRLERHPMMGADMLREGGVSDTIWLAVVEQHHESIDGSGYPGGLWEDQVSEGARIVALADLFCARVTPRSYRPAVASNVALKGILLERGKSLDQTIASHFIKTLGIFPPGMLVRLANGEIGVVTRAGGKVNTPQVKSILSADGHKLGLAVARDTGVDQFAIKETVDPKQLSAYVNMEAIWGSAAAYRG
ncbi:HD domain-containing phosphohydrolase [Chitinimonas viridis]|uniref:HD domain-containing phosphohydrolase n=1 Tax=Chitinimonas viridis TaxID=664880 RepID=A0ABT8AZI8_9NEIS|nr:HD domain-containing phosphohydrolase [Chitinimonas viridis]MDN3575175.1 HD domain-containing phosphohydrolase [Chitinimonas viridis]